MLIEEDIRAAIERELKLATGVLDRLDKNQQVTRVVAVCGLLGAAGKVWRTRKEHAESPNTLSGFSGSNQRIVVPVDPSRLSRSDLRRKVGATAEDLAVLLRRELKQ